MLIVVQISLAGEQNSSHVLSTSYVPGTLRDVYTSSNLKGWRRDVKQVARCDRAGTQSSPV